jgi:ribosomal protein L34E
MYHRKPEYKEKSRRRKLLQTYGISVEQYDEMLARQKGICAICGYEPRVQRLAVDHDHKTGRIRGLLCSRCNHALAWIEDNSPSIYERAVDYLAH